MGLNVKGSSDLLNTWRSLKALDAGAVNDALSVGTGDEALSLGTGNEALSVGGDHGTLSALAEYGGSNASSSVIMLFIAKDIINKSRIIVTQHILFASDNKQA